MEQQINDRIERYVYQVRRQLPYKSRDDIEQELRTLISDMLDERCGEKQPKQKDIDIVLMELGNPRVLAAKYAQQDRYLIGPELFPRYWMVLKIVLLCVTGAMLIASVVQAIIAAVEVGQASTAAGEYVEASVTFFVTLFSTWFATTLSALFGTFAFVTIVFALMENRDKIKLGESLNEGLEAIEKEFASDAADSDFLSSLPPVPQKNAEIKRGDTIAGIVFTCICMCLFAFASRLLAVYVSDGASVVRIPIFTPEVLNQWLPLLLIAMGLGLVREIVKLVEGRYTKRLALATIVCDGIALLLSAVVFTRRGLFNTNLLGDIAQVQPQIATDLADVAFVLDQFGYILLAVVIFAFVLDVIITVVKALKYD